MDEKKTIKKYICRKKPMDYIAMALLIAVPLCLIMAIVSVMRDNASEAEEFSPYSPVNSYAYVRIIGVSDWVCGYDDGDTYYTGIDRYDNLCVLCIKDSDFRTLGEYRDYFEGDYPGGGVPYPKTMYGQVKRMNSEMKESFAEYFDVSVAVLDDYLGGVYLDTGTTPGESSMGGWLGCVFIFLILGLCMAVPGLITKRNCKKSLAGLEQAGLLGTAASQLESPTNFVLGKDEVRLTRDFIFSRSGVAIRYEELVWCYKRVQRVNFIPVSASLIASTATMPNFALVVTSANDKKGLMDQVMEEIYQHNPNIMLGYSGENQKAYRQIAKEAKANRRA